MTRDMLFAAMVVVAMFALIAGAVARGIGPRVDAQRAADLAALAGRRPCARHFAAIRAATGGWRDQPGPPRA